MLVVFLLGSKAGGWLVSLVAYFLMMMTGGHLELTDREILSTPVMYYF
jgi:hypothetical protein